MFSLPIEFLTVLSSFRHLFSQPVWPHALSLVLGALLCQRQRTVCSCLRAVGLGQGVDFSKYHHVLNRSRWSCFLASRILLGLLLAGFVPSRHAATVGIDATLERRNGKRIQAKGRYHDAARSQGQAVVTAWGLQWLCLMLIVPVPWSARPWALPFMTLLMPSQKANEAKGKTHKTSVDWAIQALKCLRRWQPTRDFIVLADGGFASFDLLRTCCRQRLSLIARLRIDARLYEFPPEPTPGKRDPKPKKGKLIPYFPTLAQQEQHDWKPVTLPWYQTGEQTLRWLSGTALMHKTKQDPIPVRWVLVQIVGKKNPHAFFTNDLDRDPVQLLIEYMKRWSAEICQA